MVTVMYVIGTIYRTRLLGLRFVERKEACIGRELWRFFLRYPVFWWLPWRGKNRLLCWDCLQKLVCNRFLQTAWVWQCPEASRHWHRECSTALAISREVTCKRFVFLFFNRRSTTSWYCNEWTSFRLVNLNKCIISNYLQVFSICHVFFFSVQLCIMSPNQYGSFFPCYTAPRH